MRRVVVFGLVALLGWSTAAIAQPSTAFTGRLVDDASEAPVAGATVSIVGLAGTARTDDDGRFSWTPPPPVPFHLIVVLAGGQVARPVMVDAIDQGITSIRVQSLADEAVTVLGAAPSIDASPAAATTVLSGSQVRQRNPENLMQALETVPGISQVSEGHAAVPAVRGLARGRTLLLIDGGRVTSERRVGASGTFVDPSVIEGIDVARGPGSVAYGSDAIGGVVSVRTRRAEPSTPLRARFTGTLGVGVPEARGSFEMSKGLERGGILVQAHLRNAEDYDSPEGEVFNSGWEDRGFLAHFTHTVGTGFLSAVWQSDFGRDFERPRNNSRSVRFYYPYENTHRFTGSYEVPEVVGFEQVTFTAFLGRYDQRTDQDRFPTATTGRSIERADLSANDFHLKGSAERTLGTTRIEFGVDANGRYNLRALDVTQTFDVGGTLTADALHISIDGARRTDAGVYVEGETILGSLTRLSAGVRVDRVTTNNVGGFFGNRATSHTAASGFAALTVGPFSGVSVTAQVARGFRDPVLSDRYFRGPSGRGFITGNPDLDPEKSLQFDLSTRYSAGRSQLGVFFYHYRLTDLVERYQTATDFFFFRNRGRARLRGFEIEARSDFGNGYSIEIAAQLARGRALDDDAYLDDISPATLSALVRKEFGTRFYTQARLGWNDTDNRPGPSEVASPGFTLLDVGGGWRVSPQVEIRAIVRNLLDESYYASPDPRWVLAPGRSLAVTSVLQF